LKYQRILMRTLFTNLVTSLVFCGLASAGTLTLTCTSTAGPLGAGDSFALVSECPWFNLPGETLESVQVSPTLTISGTLSLSNETNLAPPGVTPNPVDQTGEEFLLFHIQYEGFESKIGIDTMIPVSLDMTLDSGIHTVGPGDTLLVPATVSGSATSMADPGFWTQFPSRGPGTTQLIAKITPISETFFGVSSTSFSFPIDAFQLTAAVTYDYSSPASDTPEPGTLLTLGAGLLGMATGVFRRLRST
jgi:hypothetical protein